MKKALSTLFLIVVAFVLIYTKAISSHQKRNEIPWASSARVVLVESVFWTLVLCGFTYVMVKFGDDNDDPPSK